MGFAGSMQLIAEGALRLSIDGEAVLLTPTRVGRWGPDMPFGTLSQGAWLPVERSLFERMAGARSVRLTIVGEDDAMERRLSDDDLQAIQVFLGERPPLVRWEIDESSRHRPRSPADREGRTAD